jgi:formylmethanofuran dehydrogenase subunit C
MLHLKLHTTPSVPLEAPCLVPDRLAPLSTANIAQLPVLHGNTPGRLGDFFAISGDAADGQIEVHGDCSRIKWLGAKMAAGRLVVRGSSGMHTGSGMSGGELIVDGDVDDWAGAEMTGGLLSVHGSTGDHCAAAYPGSFRGMTGGIVLVGGSTGVGTAAVMRRGLVAVGACGPWAGASMIAGSLFVFGDLGRGAGANMKRGSIVALGPPPEILPTFRPSCDYQAPFLELYLRRLRALGYTSLSTPQRMRRYCGDMVSLGLGEILTTTDL